MNRKKYIGIAIGLSTLASIALAIPALAAENQPANRQRNANEDIREGKMMGRFGGPGITGKGVVGTVSNINGNTITITSKQGRATTTSSTFTVDATNAVVLKNNATSTLSKISVGDVIMAQGTITGTNVVATTIHDGFGGKMMGGNNGGVLPPQIQGNGQPIVAGSVTAINGSSITVTNKSNVTYTIDATNAKIYKGNTTIAVSNIAVGDEVVAQGTVNGNAVVASTVIDQVAKPANTGNDQNKGNAPHLGFFGGIGQFFSHLFGF